MTTRRYALMQRGNELDFPTHLSPGKERGFTRKSYLVTLVGEMFSEGLYMPLGDEVLFPDLAPQYRDVRHVPSVLLVETRALLEEATGVYAVHAEGRVHLAYRELVGDFPPRKKFLGIFRYPHQGEAVTDNIVGFVQVDRISRARSPSRSIHE